MILTHDTETESRKDDCLCRHWGRWKQPSVTLTACGDTCQIWMWFEESNMYFCEIENFAYGEINERSFSNPHPRCTMVNQLTKMSNSS